MKNFKKLRVWQNGFDIAVKSYKLVQTFPKEALFGIAGQITSSALSIPSNIAEGSSRSSEKDYCRFIEIALGSSFELDTQVLVADALNFGDTGMRRDLMEMILQEHTMLHSFLSTLRGS